MTISVHGIDGWLLVLAALCFLLAAVTVGAEKRWGKWWPALIASGLLAWVLTGLVH